MSTAYKYLTDADVEQFLTRGHMVVKNAFTKEAAAPYYDLLWTRLGYDPDDKATWKEARTHMPGRSGFKVSEFAPRAYGAICELMGGEERLKLPMWWGDSFIVNLGSDDDARTWQPPSAKVGGWHKDGDWFRHFLDSPEQGLLVIALWSDVVPTGGGTFVACDSVPIVARYLENHPEGVEPNGFGFQNMVTECHDFIEITGKAGDVVLIHPYLLHASSQNALRAVRVITNPSISLNEPMRFDRENPDDFSLVEQAILRGLGKERLDWEISGERQRIVPERERIQAQMKIDEASRLAASGS